MAGNKTKLMMNIDKDLLAQVDKYADDLCITRTSAVCVLLKRALQSEEALVNLSKLMKVYEDEKAKMEEKKS